MFLFLQLIVVITLLGNVRTEGPVTIIRNLLQNNLVGAPVIHKITTWNFDPEVSLKRREQFQEVCIFDGSFELIYRFSRGLNFFLEIFRRCMVSVVKSWLKELALGSMERQTNDYKSNVPEMRDCLAERFTTSKLDWILWNSAFICLLRLCKMQQLVNSTWSDEKICLWKQHCWETITNYSCPLPK